jgi:predicted metal-dependent phosphoesterase TrpH
LQEVQVDRSEQVWHCALIDEHGTHDKELAANSQPILHIVQVLDVWLQVLQLLIYEHYKQVVAFAKKFPALQERHAFEVWLHILQFVINEHYRHEFGVAR